MNNGVLCAATLARIDYACTIHLPSAFATLGEAGTMQPQQHMRPHRLTSIEPT
jgi:hypothetical protein